MLANNNQLTVLGPHHVAKQIQIHELYPWTRDVTRSVEIPLCPSFSLSQPCDLGKQHRLSQPFKAGKQCPSPAAPRVTQLFLCSPAQRRTAALHSFPTAVTREPAKGFIKSEKVSTSGTDTRSASWLHKQRVLWSRVGIKLPIQGITETSVVFRDTEVKGPVWAVFHQEASQTLFKLNWLYWIIIVTDSISSVSCGTPLTGDNFRPTVIFTSLLRQKNKWKYYSAADRSLVSYELVSL